MMDLEAPWIGYAPDDDEEEKTYYCPECGHECEKLYVRWHEVLGCDYCIDECDACDWEDCNDD